MKLFDKSGSFGVLIFSNHQYFFVTSSMIISSLLIILFFTEESNVKEAKREVVLQKTESMKIKDC